MESSVSMWADNLKQATEESLKNQFTWLKFIFNLINKFTENHVKNIFTNMYNGTVGVSKTEAVQKK